MVGGRGDLHDGASVAVAAAVSAGIPYFNKLILTATTGNTA